MSETDWKAARAAIVRFRIANWVVVTCVTIACAVAVATAITDVSWLGWLAPFSVRDPMFSQAFLDELPGMAIALIAAYAISRMLTRRLRQSMADNLSIALSKGDFASALSDAANSASRPPLRPWIRTSKVAKMLGGQSPQWRQMEAALVAYPRSTLWLIARAERLLARKSGEKSGLPGLGHKILVLTVNGILSYCLLVGLGLSAVRIFSMNVVHANAYLVSAASTSSCTENEDGYVTSGAVLTGHHWSDANPVAAWASRPLVASSRKAMKTFWDASESEGCPWVKAVKKASG